MPQRRVLANLSASSLFAFSADFYFVNITGPASEASVRPFLHACHMLSNGPFFGTLNRFPLCAFQDTTFENTSPDLPRITSAGGAGDLG